MTREEFLRDRHAVQTKDALIEYLGGSYITDLLWRRGPLFALVGLTHGATPDSRYSVQQPISVAANVFDLVIWVRENMKPWDVWLDPKFSTGYVRSNRPLIRDGLFTPHDTFETISGAFVPSLSPFNVKCVPTLDVYDRHFSGGAPLTWEITEYSGWKPSLPTIAYLLSESIVELQPLYDILHQTLKNSGGHPLAFDTRYIGCTPHALTGLSDEQYHTLATMLDARRISALNVK